MSFEAEKDLLLHVFCELGYPLLILNNTVAKFESMEPKNDVAHAPPTGANFKHTVLVLPYIPGISDAIARSWRRCAKTLRTPIETTVAFQPVRKLRSYVCNLYEKEEQGRGVYRASCGHCNSFYVGETSLFLQSRITTHKYQKEKGAIWQHADTTGHTFGDFDWEIIFKEPDLHKRKIAEAFKA